MWPKYQQPGLILLSLSRKVQVEGERTHNSASIDSRRRKISSRAERLPSKRWRCKRYKQPLIRADIYQQTAGGLWKPTLSFHWKGFSWMCNIHVGLKIHLSVWLLKWSLKWPPTPVGLSGESLTPRRWGERGPNLTGNKPRHSRCEASVRCEWILIPCVFCLILKALVLRSRHLPSL